MDPKPIFEYAPAQADGGTPKAALFIRCGPALENMLDHGRTVVYVAGGHVSMSGCASYKFMLLPQHQITKETGWKVFRPLNNKKVPFDIVVRPIVQHTLVFDVAKLSDTQVKVMNAFTGNEVVQEMHVEMDMTMASFKRRLMDKLVDQNVCSQQQAIGLSKIHSSGQRLKRFFEDGEDEVKSKRRKTTK